MARESARRARQAAADMHAMESALCERGFQRVAGIDEAGRGPLAGPVVAAAVIPGAGMSLQGVNDSKQLTPAQRDTLYEGIMAGALAVGVGMASAAEIDRINILAATKLATRRALRNLRVLPDYLLLDALHLERCTIPQESVIKGDARCFCIAAASIVAKVTRDRLMEQYDAEYPVYGFASHKGYPTPTHYDAITRHGHSTLHRRSFFDPSMLAPPVRFSQTFTIMSSGGLPTQQQGASGVPLPEEEIRLLRALGGRIGMGQEIDS